MSATRTARQAKPPEPESLRSSLVMRLARMDETSVVFTWREGEPHALAMDLSDWTDFGRPLALKVWAEVTDG